MKCYPNIILIDFLRGLNPLRRTFYFNYIVQWDKDVIKKKCLLWIDLYTHGYIFAKCLMAQPPIYLLHFLLILMEIYGGFKSKTNENTTWQKYSIFIHTICESNLWIKLGVTIFK